MRQTREVVAEGFDSVEVGSAIQAEITRGDRFTVTVDADESIMDQVQVEVRASTLTMDLALMLNLNWLLRPTPVTVRVVMPDLVRLSAGGASQVHVGGFVAEHALDIHASGASTVKAELTGHELHLDAAGASHVDLAGHSQSLAISISGASSVDLTSMAASRARANVSGASSASLNVSEHLDYSLTGASHLHIIGSPRVGQAHMSGASSFSTG